MRPVWGGWAIGALLVFGLALSNEYTVQRGIGDGMTGLGIWSAIYWAVVGIVRKFKDTPK